MTEEQKKEAISKEFLRILAVNHGFKVVEPGPDHGVDMIVYPVTARIEASGRTRYLDSPYKLDFQLKATTPNGIVDSNDAIKFDLEVKTYNDLVYRRDQFLPLHLVLVVLHAAPPNCVNVDEGLLGLSAKAYWYLPSDEAAASDNDYQVRITIPKANQLTSEFVRDRYEFLGIDI
ncbi:MAG: DUF4365 domain-containing protein [Pseudomonadota bacterium]